MVKNENKEGERKGGRERHDVVPVSPLADDNGAAVAGKDPDGHFGVLGGLVLSLELVNGGKGAGHAGGRKRTAYNRRHGRTSRGRQNGVLVCVLTTSWLTLLNRALRYQENIVPEQYDRPSGSGPTRDFISSTWKSSSEARSQPECLVWKMAERPGVKSMIYARKTKISLVPSTPFQRPQM